MFSSAFGIVVALFFLSFLIFIHELAHFLAGKAVGIHAEVFSIGFGPAIWSFRRGTTEYRLAVFPAGGYVKFPGEYAEGSERMEGEFAEAAVWKRMVTVAAGPLSNLVLGMLIFAALAMFGLPDKSMPPIGDIIQSEAQVGSYWDDPVAQSPAAKAGILPGDRVLAVNDRPINSWDQFTQEVMIHPDDPISITVQRNGETKKIAATPRSILRGKMTVGQIGVAPMQPIVVEPNPGAKVVVTALDGEPVYGFDPFRRKADSAAELPLSLTLADGSTRAVRLERRTLDMSRSEPGREVVLTHADGQPVERLDDVRRIVLADADGRLTLTFRGPSGENEVPIERAVSATVTGADTSKDSAVRELRLGDRLIAVNGVAAKNYAEVEAILKNAAESRAEVRLTFERQSRALFVKWETVKNVKTPVLAENGHYRIPGLTLQSNFADPSFLTLGDANLAEQLELRDAATDAPLPVSYADPKIERFGPVGAVGKGVKMTGETVSDMLSLLKRLVVGDVSMKYISGPVGIVNITQKTLARGGWTWGSLLSVMYLTAFISINLAIVNLLPIPIADGGQLLFFTIEGLRRKPLSMKVQVAIQQVSILALMGLFILITLKDLVYW